MFSKWAKNNLPRAWLQWRHTDNVSIRLFLSAQPKIWKVSHILGVLLLVFAELFGVSSWLLRVLIAVNLFNGIMIYVRTRIYWPITRANLDWKKVEKVVEEDVDT